MSNSVGITTKKPNISDILKKERYKRAHHLVEYGFSDKKLSAPIKPSLVKSKLNNIINNVCYSRVYDILYEHSELNIIYTWLELSPKLKHLLSTEKMKRWINLLKQYKMLPQNIDADKTVKYNKYVNAMFSLKKTKYIQTLYMYLSCIRNMREDPAYVKVVIELVDIYGYDFYIALVMASYYAIGNQSHHIFPIGYKYPVPKNHMETLYNLRYAKALRMFVEGNTQHTNNINNSTDWSMTSMLNKLVMKNHEVKFEYLKKKEALKYVYED